MSSHRQLKRPRTEDLIASHVPRIHYLDVKDCKFSTKFHHTSGDILIRVKTTWYLLHRGLLATQSKLFRAEAIGQMASGQVYMGMQVFVPPCDDVQNWERVLTSVYDPVRLDIWGKTLSSGELFSLIQIARTLKFYNVVTLCIERLETELPTTLDAFDATYTVPTTGSILMPTSYISTTAELFRTINLALEFGNKRALPCAYLLALMEASMEDISQGITSPDGSRVQLHSEARHTLLTANIKISRGLGKRFSDTITCSTARRHSCISKPPSPACRSAANALEARLRVYIAHSITVNSPRLAIASWRKGNWFEGGFKNRCFICSESARTQMTAQRKQFWDEIPALFELGDGWNDLGCM